MQNTSQKRRSKFIFKLKEISIFLFFLSFIFSCNRQRTVKEYYDDGSLKYELQIQNNEPHGFAKYYYPNGKQKIDSYYENGKLTGKSLKYYENGDLYVSANYLSGKLHGWKFTYNKDKTLNSKINWDNGKPDLALTFTENGDTLSYSFNKKTITYAKPGKIFEIICAQDTNNIKSIRLHYDGSIIRYNGPLTCLTKRDSMLLFSQNPNWTIEIQKENLIIN